MVFVKAISTVRPADKDTTSSKKYNYIRRNIVEQTIEEEGEQRTIFSYEEARIRKEDWGTFQELTQQRADIDYLLMLSGED